MMGKQSFLVWENKCYTPWAKQSSCKFSNTDIEMIRSTWYEHNLDKYPTLLSGGISSLIKNNQSKCASVYPFNKVDGYC